MKTGAILIQSPATDAGELPQLKIKRIFYSLFLAVRRRMMQELGIRLSFYETLATINFITSFVAMVAIASGGELGPIACGSVYFMLSYFCVKPIFKRLNITENEK